MELAWGGGKAEHGMPDCPGSACWFPNLSAPHTVEYHHFPSHVMQEIWVWKALCVFSSTNQIIFKPFHSVFFPPFFLTDLRGPCHQPAVQWGRGHLCHLPSRVQGTFDPYVPGKTLSFAHRLPLMAFPQLGRGTASLDNSDSSCWAYWIQDIHWMYILDMCSI